MKNHQRLGEDKIIKLLYDFSVPALIGGLVIFFYNVVDRLFVLKGINETAFAALGICFYLLMIFISVSMLVGVGAGSVISIKLGQKKKGESERVLGNAITLYFIIGIIIFIILEIFMKEILIVSGTNKETLPYALTYMRIIMPTIFATSYSFGLTNIIQAQGNPNVSMIAMAIGGLSNLLLDYIFIFIFNWGIAGAAIATLIGNVLSMVFVLYFFIKGKTIFYYEKNGKVIGAKSSLILKRKNLILNKRIVRNILKIGVSPFALQIVNALVGLFINYKINELGEKSEIGGTGAIAIMTIVNTYLMFIIMSVYALAQGAQPILGYNYGAKKYQRVRRTFYVTMGIGILFTMIFFLIVNFNSKMLIDLFNKYSSDNKTAINVEYGIRVMKIYFSFVFAASIGVIGPIFFQSIGKPKESLFLNIFRQTFLYLIILIIFTNKYGLDGVWYAQPLTDVLFSIIVIVLLTIEIKKLKKL